MLHRHALRVGASLLLVISVGGCGPSSPTLPDSPDGTVVAISKSLADGKPEVLWAALPASYQKELQDDIVRAFAAKMDPEIYGKGVAVVKKLSAILRDKKDFILPQVVENPMFQMAQIDKAKFSQNWDKVVGLFDTVLSSEVGDLGRLKTADLGSFLRVTGGKLMGQVADLSALSAQDPYKQQVQSKMASVKAEVVKVDGDRAMVKVSTPGQEGSTGEMVKVEGRWLPREVAEGWKDGMAKAKAQIAAIDEKAMAAAKPKIMGTLAGVETALDQLAKTKTAEEFAQAAAGLMSNLPLPAGLMGMGPDEGESPSGSPPDANANAPEETEEK